MRTFFQALQVMRIIAAFPAIEGLWADPKVATGKSAIVVMGAVVVKPFKSLPGSF
jgi:hypothetical protein